MKKFDFKKLVLMGVVAGTALSVSSLSAAGANDESSNSSSQTKKTKPATRQTPTKNTNTNNNNRNTYNKYTADNSSYSTDPKPSPYRSSHPFDNRYAADDKSQSIQGDDSNFTVPDSYGSKNNPNNPNNPSNANYSTRPGANAPRGNATNAWESAPKSNDELADNYNTNQTPYQQRMSSKNWYGDSGVPSAPSPRASDGVYYEDMTNPNQAGNRNPSNYNSNVPQPSSSNYSNAPRPVGNPVPVNAPSSQYSNSGPQYNAQQYPNRTPAPQPQQSQPVQGRILHSDNGYQGGGGGSHGCPGGCGTGAKKR